MTILEEVKQTLNLESMYRFEGHISHSYYNVNDCLITPDINEAGYIYFSKTLNHHAYFISKRILQFISTEILKDTKLNLEATSLLDIHNYHTILKLLENYNKEMPMTSIEFSLCPIWLPLIKQNTISNNTHHFKKLIIDSDKHIKKGGYAFCDEWLYLFHLLTIMYCYQPITKDDVIRFFKAFRLSIINPNYPLNYQTTIFNDYHRQIILNPNLANDFSKYEIINALESLIENRKINPESMLAQEPSKTIKSTVNQYERIRKKTNTTLEAILKRDIEN